MRRSRVNPTRQAFTLIELLVVAAILVILGCILLPAMTNAKQTTMRIRCTSNLKQIGMLSNLGA
jgi:prepilin-type N-terminal cleavage/methylation domain-containing protein